MPINKAVYAAISRLLPHAKHTYRIQRMMDNATSHLETGLKHICDVQDVQLKLTDGTSMTISVSTPLITSDEYKYSEFFQADKKTLKDLAHERQGREEKEQEARKIQKARDIEERVRAKACAKNPDTVCGEIPVTSVKHANEPVAKHAPTLRGDILFIHGGGWTTGSAALYADVCANLALQTQRRVFSVDYRLAPDYRYPVPLSDCLDAAKAFFNGTMPVPDVPGAPKTIDVKNALLFGDSAGGNLCAALALKGRDTGDFTVPTMILLYPCLNNDYNMDTSPYASVRENGKDYLLTAQDMADYLNMYRSSIQDLFDPYFAPLNEEDLSRQPRTLIISAEYCPLRDEDEAYARALKKAGNYVECCRIQDGVHGYLMYPRISSLVVNTYKIINHFLMNTSEEHKEIQEIKADTELVNEEYTKGEEQGLWKHIVGID